MTAEFHWDSFFSGVVLSAFWGGYALTQVLGGKLADRFGGEKLIIIAMILWSVCTALTPTAAAMGAVQVVVTRILLGAGEGLALPAIHSMIQKYVKQEGRATSAAVITAACYLGALLSNLLSPMIISNAGWRECFLIFAAFPPLIWLPLWFGFIYFFDRRSTPFNSPRGRSADSVPVASSTSLFADTKAGMANFFQGMFPQAQTVTETQRLVDNDSVASVELPPRSYNKDKSAESTSTSSSTYAENDIAKSIDSVESDESMELQSTGGGASLRKLLQSPAVWAIIAAQYGQSWGMIGLLSCKCVCTVTAYGTIKHTVSICDTVVYTVPLVYK
jgi:ACS family sodium-dependent inorganic phosphate cotransporter